MTCALAAAGCAVRREADVEVDTSKMADPQFQAYLAQAPLVTIAESYRAMLLLADGEDPATTFEERRDKLVSRGIVRAQWNLSPDQALDKGTLAFMVMRICQMRGGVNFTVFGSLGLGDRRYAVRELVYRRMIEDAVAYQVVTGGELVSLMAKADDFMEKRGLYQAEPIELPPEPGPGELPPWAQPPAATQPAAGLPVPAAPIDEVDPVPFAEQPEIVDDDSTPDTDPAPWQAPNGDRR